MRGKGKTKMPIVATVQVTIARPPELVARTADRTDITADQTDITVDSDE